MFANYREPHQFTGDEIATLATFANYAAIAILNARREEQRRLEQINLVEAISANFAHRMSNLVGTSHVAVQLLRERVALNDELSREYLNRIERDAELLTGLARRLSRSFKGTGHPYELEALDISKVIKSVLERVQPLPEGIKLTRNIEKNLPLVRSDEVQLEHVIYDIASNGIDAMRELESGELKIWARFNRQTNHIEIEIVDTGTGISDVIRKGLFAPGVTTKKDKLGIGLWWSRTFMQATGGDIILQDTDYQQGTTFVIEIPCDTDEIENLRQSHKANADILIVDDEEKWREMITNVFSNDSYVVDTASSYSEAKHAIFAKNYKLAIVDIRLIDAHSDNEDGFLLLADIQKAKLNTKVIIVTGVAPEKEEELIVNNPNLIKLIDKRNLDVIKLRNLVRKTVNQAFVL